MELKLIVSGITTGENLWGCSDDSAFMGTLYVPSKVSHKFDIRLNKIGSKIYAYYHYLVYNTINGFEGRAGSYFGITVRIDSFCTDYKTIYNVLDIAYRKKITGVILKPANDGRLQYNCHSFTQHEEYLGNLEKEIRNTIGTSVSRSDFRNIPSMPSGEGLVRLHFEDASEGDVMQAVGRYGKCSLSFEYEARELKRRLEEEFKKGSASRQAEINKFQNTIEGLTKENNKLMGQLEAAKNRTKNSVQQPRNTDTYIHETDIPDHEGGRGGQSSYTTLIMGLILVALLVGGYFLLFGGDDDNAAKSEVPVTYPDPKAEQAHRLAGLDETCKTASIKLDSLKSSDDGITYYVTVSGVPDLEFAEMYVSNGDVSDKGSGKYEIADCDKDSTIIVGLSKVGEGGSKINLKDTLFHK